MIDWLSKNKEWFFSGLGVYILGLIVSFMVFFIARFFIKSANSKQIKQSQKSGNNSTNFQAGGDIKL